MTRYEQETIINYNQEEDFALVCTCDASLIRKLDELCKVHSTITVETSDEHSKSYKFPKKWVKVRASRPLSDELRQELAERARRNFSKEG